MRSAVPYRATLPPWEKKPDKAAGAVPGKPGEGKPTEPPKGPNLRFVKLSQIVPLPGTYVKDTPRADYKELIASIKKDGLTKPVILRKVEKGDYQLVDGFHRCKALEQDGALEVRADLYEMSLLEASRYRKGHRTNPDLPIPGIQNILQNIMYQGILRSGETRSEIFPELQIISPEQFARVEQAREQRSSAYEDKCAAAWGVDISLLEDGTLPANQPPRTIPRRNTGRALLSGNVFCGH